MRFHRLFGQEKALTDLAVDETVRDELEHLDLAGGRILADLARDLRRERNDGSVPASAATRRGRLESAAVVAITVQDLLTLSGVHALGIGAPTVPL